MSDIILNYYPPVIKQIREIQAIAKAEDLEFEKLKLAINEVLNNMFVFTANERGIKRFETILGITPKSTQTLDDRRINIIAMMNRRKMSLSELTAMLSNYSEGIELINNISDMTMIVILNNDASSIEALNKVVDEILPMNIYFEFSLQRETTINYKLEDLIFMSFDPAAGENEHCNHDNNVTSATETAITTSIGGFYYTNSYSYAGQAICGLEYNLGVPAATYDVQESIITAQESQTQASNAYKVCGEDYAREEA
jgi:hypothetical protein